MFERTLDLDILNILSMYINYRNYSYAPTADSDDDEREEGRKIAVGAQIFRKTLGQADMSTCNTYRISDKRVVYY